MDCDLHNRKDQFSRQSIMKNEEKKKKRNLHVPSQNHSKGLSSVASYFQCCYRKRCLTKFHYAIGLSHTNYSSLFKNTIITYLNIQVFIHQQTGSRSGH